MDVAIALIPAFLGSRVALALFAITCACFAVAVGLVFPTRCPGLSRVRYVPGRRDVRIAFAVLLLAIGVYALWSAFLTTFWAFMAAT